MIERRLNCQRVDEDNQATWVPVILDSAALSQGNQCRPAAVFGTESNTLLTLTPGRWSINSTQLDLVPKEVGKRK